MAGQRYRPCLAPDIVVRCCSGEIDTAPCWPKPCAGKSTARGARPAGSSAAVTAPASASAAASASATAAAAPTTTTRAVIACIASLTTAFTAFTSAATSASASAAAATIKAKVTSDLTRGEPRSSEGGIVSLTASSCGGASPACAGIVGGPNS